MPPQEHGGATPGGLLRIIYDPDSRVLGRLMPVNTMISPVGAQFFCEG
jgi:hypothetical protein